MESTKTEKRSYFCKPCGYKHLYPTNRKCPRQLRRQQRSDDGSHDDAALGQPHRGSHDDTAQSQRRVVPEGEPNQGESGPSTGTPTFAHRSTSGNNTRSGRRKIRRLPSDSSEEGSPPVRTPIKRWTVSNDNDNSALTAIINKLDAIAAEGRSERAKLASASQADREYFRSAIANLQPKADVLSDDEDQGRSTTARGPVRGQGEMTALPAKSLADSSTTLQQLRDDSLSSATATDILRRNGCSDESNKKLKSGFNMTINDNATMLAEWLQLNVYRSSNDL